MITPDLAFQQAANAAAAVYASPPPYLTYHTVVHLDVPSLNKHRDVARSEVVRTQDGVAIMQDLPKGAERIGQAFPIIPTFDALSEFRVTYKMGAHDALDAHVENVRPLTYANVQSDADVVVKSLRYYYPKYAPDSSDAPDGTTHITLTPLQTLLRNYTGDLFLADLYVNNATHLPSRVVYTGDHDRRFVVDYATVDGHWIVTHATWEETQYGPLHIGRVHGTADITFDSFTFPQAAPDPRLTTLPPHAGG